MMKIPDLTTGYKCWPIEISGSAKASATSKSKSKSPEQNFHFIAYLDATALLYPGVTRTRVASQLFTFNSECAKEKCGLEKSLFDTIDMELDEGKSSQQKKPDKKSVKSQMNTTEVEEEPSEPVFTEDRKPVFIIVELELLRPLIAKRKPEDLLKSLSEAIPPREELPKQAMSAETAVVHYNHSIKIVSEIISTELQDYCYYNRKTEENVLDDFYIYLQSTEVFGQIVNILRDKVTVLIREKYCPGVTFNSNEDRQNFISDVYVNLVEEMHSTVHSLLDGGDKASEKTYDVTNDQKYFFAIESTEEGDYEKANQLYLERISKFKKNPDFWIDYALFCMQTSDTAQARESIREALSLDIRHPIGLLLYGIFHSTNGDRQEAELFFGAAIYFHPRIMEAWIILHLFYVSIEKNEGADIALRKAKKLMTQYREELNYLYMSSEPLAWSPTAMKDESVFLLTAKLLLQLHAYQFSELALSQELLLHGTSTAYRYYLSVGHYLSGRYDDAISHLQQIVDGDFKNYLARSLIGHCYYKLGDKKKAAECYNFVVDAEDRPKNLHLVNIRFGIYNVQINNFQKAKENFLEACLSSPTPRTWLGYGSACFMAGDVEEAEKAFTEANMLDPQCPNIWAYLCLVNLHLDREEEYSQCYRQLLKNQNITDDKEETRHHMDPI
ncbi:cilia- and flagella-associated protein 70-like [Schistocerca serialis cubense]|uniref:cilia- and flagella-associated protein 70-like n=1 Tax=Schistocerca serialis cubense TaxID=2023355 RepID=UPI00214EE82E|nr:cilia- and flagella-associated protein 70-like [Schistocerca serialis cubense]